MTYFGLFIDLRIRINIFIIDPDLHIYYGSGFGSTNLLWIRIRIFIMDPDPDPHIYYESGSAYLLWIRIRIFILDPDPHIYYRSGSAYFYKYGFKQCRTVIIVYD